MQTAYKLKLRRAEGPMAMKFSRLRPISPMQTRLYSLHNCLSSPG